MANVCHPEALNTNGNRLVRHHLPRFCRALRPTGIAPVNTLQKIAQLRRGHLYRVTRPTCRPNEPACLQALQIQRHAHSIMPKDLDQIALSAPKAEYLPGMRITPKSFLNLQRQRVHPPPHIRHTARNPDLHARWKRNHCPSTAESTRASPPGSTPTDTSSRRPFESTISTWPSRPGSAGTTRPGTEPPRLFVTVTGEKEAGAIAPSSPLRYCRRQIVRSERQMPCRRAVAAP